MLIDRHNAPTQWATTSSFLVPIRPRIYETASGMSYSATSSYVNRGPLWL